MNTDLFVLLPIIIPIIVAIVSVAFGFLLSLYQKRSDFRQRRKSIAVAIFVEIKIAREGAKSLYLNWDKLKENAQDPNYNFLFVLVNEVRVLDRIKIEDLSYPPAVISTITQFHNSINELYECLSTISSERFNNITPLFRVQIVEMSKLIASAVDKRAEIAMNTMMDELPSSWFKDTSINNKN